MIKRVTLYPVLVEVLLVMASKCLLEPVQEELHVNEDALCTAPDV